MRLKYLTLHGFKTFAPRTDMRFGEGLTAIVGPNGSGKSNVADAVRWVLGEQSLSNLRAKRTEDLIFAGSSNRAPLGMAEVSITLDNADRLLPLEFAEITLTRRAYRSGENEYFINKSRVRLKDVLNVASTLGQAYTVVGQGLVDAALSLRPEERRELFEEAAAIRGYFVQREDALKRLAKTQDNIERVADLVAELEPQVRRMERQAKQAQEYGRVEDELHAILREWYTARLRRGLADLRTAEQNELVAAESVQREKQVVAEKQTALAAARDQVWQRVNAVSALHEERARVQSLLASKSQGQAVLSERLAAARAQVQSLGREQTELHTATHSIERQLRVLTAEEEERTGEMATLAETERAVAASLSAIDARLKGLKEQQAARARELDDLQDRLAQLNDKLSGVGRQRAEQERTFAEAEAAISSLYEKLAAQQHLVEEKHREVLAAQQAVARVEGELTAASKAVTEARNEQAAAEGRRRDLQRRADGVAAQLATLAGEQQAQLYGGVRAVVQAAREKRLDGYVGTVAELLRVPPDLEVAVEAALGGRLQEVVMESWADAEKAIAMLKQTGAGRATFLPLDTLRTTPPPQAPRGSGIVGVAADLVEYDPQVQVVATSLLSRLLIVEDLPSARKVISGMSANAAWTLATLDGEVVRAGGSVTGGSNTRQGDARAQGRTVLAREQRRRDLLSQEEGLREELRLADRKLEAVARSLGDAGQRLAVAQNEIDGARKQHATTNMHYIEQQGVLSRLQQELAWRGGLAEEARRRMASLEVTAREIEAEVGTESSRLPELQERLQAATADVEAAAAERERVAGSAGAGQMRLAVLGEGLRNVQSRRQELMADLRRNERRLTELAERERTLEAEAEEARRGIEAAAGEIGMLSDRQAELESQAEPREREVREAEQAAARLESEQSALQSRLLESETTHSRAAVEKEHCLGVLDRLWVEVTEELGERALGLLEGAPEELLRAGLPDMGDGAALPAVPWSEIAGQVTSYLEEPEPPVDFGGMERRIYNLRSRLSRIGPVNPLAAEEYATLSERHEYLGQQLEDLTAAAEKLRSVIGELDRAMREQFAATFVLVNDAFQYFFKQLFGGGNAQLELTNPENFDSTGVEISAQPPGKRMQPLAALSGGERALTSAALLFALLRVRPVPFCVLDEVDAALDESNVTRFRSALHELGARTQFVVITHNRGTIEAANTLYGVSMAGDGTSQLLSLQVERERQAAVAAG